MTREDKGMLVATALAVATVILKCLTMENNGVEDGEE